MIEQELQEQRRAKWRVNGSRINTMEDAQAFIEEVGFCLMYPVRPPRPGPTFIGAITGGDEGLPLQQQAFSDSRCEKASELMIRLLRSRSAYESNLFGETPFLISASVFPFFFAAVSDHNPRQPPKRHGKEKASPLMVHTFQQIQEHGPLNKRQLRERLGGDLSETAIDRVLHDLWSALKITRVDYSAESGASWDVLHRWAPEAVREGTHLSQGEALSALISKYVDCFIAVEQSEIEDFFSMIAPRSRIRETINALLNAREFHFVSIDGRTLIGGPQFAVQKTAPNRELRRPPLNQKGPSLMRRPKRGQDA